MKLRSRVAAPSATSMSPHEGESSAPTEPTASPGPPILSTQVTASGDMRMLDTNEVEDAELLAIADTLISLRAPPSQLPPPLPVQPPPDSATYPQQGLCETLDPSLVLIELFSLGRTTEALRAIIGTKSAISLQRGSVDPKFRV